MCLCQRNDSKCATGVCGEGKKGEWKKAQATTVRMEGVCEKAVVAKNNE